MKNTIAIDSSIKYNNGICKKTSILEDNIHYHKQVEIVYILKGEINIELNEEKIYLTKDQFIIIKPYELHKIITSQNSLYFLTILPLSSSTGLAHLNLQSTVFTKKNTDLLQAIRMYENYKKISADYINNFYALISSITFTLLNKKSTNKTLMEDKIINYINANFYNSNTTLQSIANACATNRTYVSNTINRQMNINVSAYINKLRINLFLQLFLNSQNSLTIENLASSVGFSSTRQFYRTFKSELGCTPQEYYKMKNL